MRAPCWVPALTAGKIKLSKETGKETGKDRERQEKKGKTYRINIYIRLYFCKRETNQITFTKSSVKLINMFIYFFYKMSNCSNKLYLYILFQYNCLSNLLFSTIKVTRCIVSDDSKKLFHTFQKLKTFLIISNRPRLSMS